jgi:hypothetical protein
LVTIARYLIHEVIPERRKLLMVKEDAFSKFYSDRAFFTYQGLGHIDFNTNVFHKLVISESYLLVSNNHVITKDRVGGEGFEPFPFCKELDDSMVSHSESSS